MCTASQRCLKLGWLGGTIAHALEDVLHPFKRSVVEDTNPPIVVQSVSVSL